MTQIEQCHHIWRTVFGDSEEFMDLYFSRRYPKVKTFASEQDGIIAAQAQCFIYNMTAAPGAPMLTIGYVSGLATLPAYRHQGHAANVMQQMHRWLNKHHIDYCLLIPATQKAAQWYTTHFGYQGTSTHCKSLATPSQIAACTPQPELTPHIIYIIQRHLASLPYTIQHTADDLRDQMDVCLMSGGGLYQTGDGHYFMAEKIATPHGEDRYMVLDTTEDYNLSGCQTNRITTPLLFLPISNHTPLPDELHVSLMLD